MKRELVLLLIWMLSINVVYAAEETLFDDDFRIGFMGGPSFNYTQFNGEDGMLVGGMLALTFNNTIYLGGAGYGLVTEHDYPGPYGDILNPRYNMGYGGAVVGAMLGSDKLYHVNLECLLGGGGIDVTDKDWDDDNHNSHDGDMFLVMQPKVNLEVNLTKWMRIDAGIGYRIVDDVEDFGLENDDLNGIIAGVTFRFGAISGINPSSWWD